MLDSLLSTDHWIWFATGLLYFAAVINCFRILSARRSPASSISWLWAHLAVPFLAVPLYWFIGRVRLIEYQRKKQKKEFEFVGYYQPESATSHPEKPAIKLKEFMNVFDHFGPIFTAYQNQANLLIDGVSTFDAIFAAMADAKRYIIVQYYILQSDKLGLELKEILLKKADEGVKIFVLYDDMGSFWLSKQYIKDLRKKGVRTARFLPVTSLKRIFLLNFRNHRKLVGVDGHIAFTGGLNVGEQYVGSRFKKNRYWRDTHVMIKGPAVRQLEEVFFSDWEFATGEKLGDALKKLKLFQQIEDSSPILEAGKSHPFVQVIPSGPTDHTVIGMLVFSEIIQTAKQRVWIATPYFVPDEALQKDLELAVLRGVDVRLLLPKVSDNRFVHWVTLSYAEQMQRIGVRVFLYETGFTHQKVILADDDLTSIGTANFDYRAMYLNFETMILVHCKELSKHTEAMLENDFASSKEFVREPNERIRALTRFRDNGARLLAPLL